MSRRKTHQEYYEECKEKGLDLPIDSYVNAKTKLHYKCNVCGSIYVQVAYNHLKRGNNCENCKRRNKFVNKLKNKYNGDYILVGDYKGSRTPTKFKHKCGYVFEDLPIHLTLKGINCPICEHTKHIDINAIRYYLTINYPEFELVSTNYKNIKSPLILEHKVCGTQFERAFDKIKQRGLSCPNTNCGGKINWNTNMVKNMLLHTYGSNYKLKSDYINYHSDLRIKCVKHHCCYTTTLSYLLRNGRDNSKTCNCPICASEQRLNNRTGITKKKTPKEYYEECKEKNLDLPLENYINSTTKIKHKCSKGHTYEQNPSDHLCGRSCPICKESHGEIFIRNYFDIRGISYEAQKTFVDLKDKAYLSYDFYLPKYNILIEYQGIQHYSEKEYFGGEQQFKVQQYHDKLKRDYAKKHGYKLLELHYSLDTQEKVNKYLERRIK